jgi:hypothetical protein
MHFLGKADGICLEKFHPDTAKIGKNPALPSVGKLCCNGGQIHILSLSIRNNPHRKSCISGAWA